MLPTINWLDLNRIKENDSNLMESEFCLDCLTQRKKYGELQGTCPCNTASHPKILQSSTQLREPQSYIKEVVSKSQTQHTGAGLVETDQNQVSTFTTHAKQETF
jgi:nitrate/TMAO reductase-like tetraheme cytochrome c subunit